MRRKKLKWKLKSSPLIVPKLKTECTPNKKLEDPPNKNRMISHCKKQEHKSTRNRV